MDARVLHQRAHECLRLAKECSDAFAREALLELAAEFKNTARLIEAERAAA
jgi:hypothetical protein